MADEWLKFRLHPEHPKILRIAELTGMDSEKVTGKVVRWFRHIDQYCNGPVTGIGIAAFQSIVRTHPVEHVRGSESLRAGEPARGSEIRLTLLEAMQDKHVGWVRMRDDGTIEVLEYEKHFGHSAKRRADDAKRKSLARRPQNVCNTSDAQRTPSDSDSSSDSHSVSDPPLTEILESELRVRDTARTRRFPTSPDSLPPDAEERLTALLRAYYGGADHPSREFWKWVDVWLESGEDYVTEAFKWGMAITPHRSPREMRARANKRAGVAGAESAPGFKSAKQHDRDDTEERRKGWVV